jgi:hypothetical protein
VGNVKRNERRIAAAEALEQYKAATQERKRAVILAFPQSKDGTHPEPVNVTEEVVSILDMIVTSMDWGSDFWSDDDLPAFITLCSLLKFDEMPKKENG